MKTTIYCLIQSSALLYFPLFPSEEFETPKAMALISFGCFALCAVKWRQILTNKLAQVLSLFVGSVAISTAFSIDWRISVFGNPKLNNGLLVYLSYLVLYLALLQHFKKYSDRLNLIRVVIATSFIVSVYALMQVMGYDFKAWHGILYEYGYTRPMSLLGHPNFMAAYLSMVMPFVLYCLDQAKAKLEKALYVVVFICLCLAILFSQSRGMWWADIIGVLTYYLMIKAPIKRIIHMCIACVILLSACALLSKPFRQGAYERLTLSTSIGKDRLEYFKGALRIWKKYPILGSGTDTYELAFQHQRTPQYWGIQANGSPHRAHNEFLNVLATQGLLGFVCGLILTATIFLTIVASRSALSAPATASIAVFYIQEISSFHVIATSTLLIICLMLLNEGRAWKQKKK